jgi:hypothetical protein
VLRTMGLCALPILLASCANTGAGPNDGCAGWRAIYVASADVLTDGTARQVLAHNGTGRARGCW